MQVRSAAGTPRITRVGLRALVATAVGASLVVGGAPAFAATRHATHVTAVPSATVVKVKAPVVVVGTVKPAVKGMAVSLQRFNGHHWLTVSHTKESKTGVYALAVKAPGKTGTLLLRVVRAAAKADTAGVSRKLSIHVVATAYAVSWTAGRSVASGAPIVVTGKVKPAGTGSVGLQRLVGTHWSTLATAKLTKASAYSLSTVQKAGTYKLRVVKPQTAKVAGGVGTSFTVVVAAAPVVVPVTAPVISTTSLPAGITHHAYAATLAATGGSGTLTWSAAAGSLPAGIALSAAGVLSGTPAAGGTTTVTVTVTDAGARTASTALTLSVSLATGTLSAWGYNNDGELADGIRPDRDTATQVAGLAGVTKIAGGARIGYALTSGGAVLAYGVGEQGELGNGTLGYAAAPVQVTGLTSGVTAIAAGGGGAYALKSDGTVWAWGGNGSGQLGNASNNDSLVPVQVSGLTGVTAIAGGSSDGYALKSNGTVWAWGYNSDGEIGDGTTNDSNVPVLVTGLTGQAVTAIAAGSETGYALMADHTVRAWGYNNDGEVGDASTTTRLAAVAVSGLTTVTAITASASEGYALKTAGTEFAWGYNGDGELGNSNNTDSDVPVQVTGLTTVTAIGASSASSYAVLADHTLRSWGYNGEGELGNGTTTSADQPVTVTGLASVSLVAGGGEIGYALKTDGTVWNWGGDPSSLLDHPAAGPIALTGTTSVVADSGGGLAIKSDGTVWDWGVNWSGQLGNGTYQPYLSDVPVQVSGLTGVIAVAGNGSARYAVKSDGTVWAWGDNSVNELGVSALGSSNVPVQVAGLAGVTAIVAGADDSEYVLKSDGSVWAWGTNSSGELGNNTTTDSAAPVRVGLPAGVTAIAAGYETGYAIGAGGAVFGWGSNANGQLGNGSVTDAHVPVAVAGLAGVTAIAAGSDFGLALRADGTVVGWGDNGSGQLGNGSLAAAHVPVQVSGLAGVSAISAGSSDGYAVTSAGLVMSWGYNGDGQLGIGTTGYTAQTTPVTVPGLTGIIGIAANADSTFALKLS